MNRGERISARSMGQRGARSTGQREREQKECTTEDLPVGAGLLADELHSPAQASISAPTLEHAANNKVIPPCSHFTSSGNANKDCESISKRVRNDGDI